MWASEQGDEGQVWSKVDGTNVSVLFIVSLVFCLVGWFFDFLFPCVHNEAKGVGHSLLSNYTSAQG